MSTPLALRPSLPLRAASVAFTLAWCLVAAFPIFWITVMSFKEPVDAFAPNPLAVIFGPMTRAAGKGLSILDLLLLAAVVGVGGTVAWRQLRHAFGEDAAWPRRLIVVAATALAAILAALALPVLMRWLDGMGGPLARPVIGLTLEHYEAVWIRNQFYRNFLNSMMVTGGVVVTSLTVATLAGYGLSRSGSALAFWILIVALVFRALPHSVLVAGYLPWFINSAEILHPILGPAAPTLYGQPLAVIAVLVAINQPFTIWLLRSFFQSIPTELDEAARVDGCTHFQAFRLAIMPVMWPGVLTAGLFSFLLGYNDYLVTSLLLDAQNQTMVPAITSYFNSETTMRDQVEAVAAAVSITAPLLVLVLAFQGRIVSGLTAGAVKG